MRNINLKYKREREVLGMISKKIVSIAYSGGKWQSGREDGQSDELIVQVKSTLSNTLTVAFHMIYDILQHKKPTQTPLLVLDFANPRNHIGAFSEQIWVAMPLADFKRYALPAIEATTEAL